MKKTVLEQTGKEVQDLLNKIDAIDTIKLQEVLQQYTPDLIEKIYYPPFLGKKISILGDSISTFSGYIPSGNAAWYPRGEITSVKDTWWYQLIQQQEAILGINESWSGSKVAADGETKSMCATARIKNLGNNGTPDLILFYGGTNDIDQDSTALTHLGSFDSSKRYDNIDIDSNEGCATNMRTSTYAIGFRVAIQKMQKLYPLAKIVVLLPLYTGWTSGDSSSGNGYPMQMLEAYNNVAKSICDYFGINYIDLRKAGINAFNLEEYMGNGGDARNIHPNKAGMKLLCNYISSQLSSFFRNTDRYHLITLTNGLTLKSGNYRVKNGSFWSDTIILPSGTMSYSEITIRMNGSDITSSLNTNTGVVSVDKVTGTIEVIYNTQSSPEIVNEWYYSAVPANVEKLTRESITSGVGFANGTQETILVGKPVNSIRFKAARAGIITFGKVDASYNVTVVGQHDIIESEVGKIVSCKLNSPVTLKSGEKLIVHAAGVSKTSMSSTDKGLFYWCDSIEDGIGFYQKYPSQPNNINRHMLGIDWGYQS